MRHRVGNGRRCRALACRSTISVMPFYGHGQWECSLHTKPMRTLLILIDPMAHSRRAFIDELSRHFIFTTGMMLTLHPGDAWLGESCLMNLIVLLCSPPTSSITTYLDRFRCPAAKVQCMYRFHTRQSINYTCSPVPQEIDFLLARQLRCFMSENQKPKPK